MADDVQKGKADRILVLTGGSAGIGRQTALCFADNGYLVYELSRSGSSQQHIIHIDTDVTDPIAVQEAMRQVSEQTNGIDVLICNAGYGISGAVEYTEIQQAKSQFDVNFFGTALCIQYALPLLRKKRGRIMCIGSVAGIIPVPFQAYYSASKAATTALCEALVNEVAAFGIQVCCVQLGNIRTDFTDARQKGQQGDDMYQGRISRSVSVMEEEERNGMEPSYVSGQLLRIAKKKRLRPCYTVGFIYKAYDILVRLLPKKWVLKIVGYIYAI